MRKFFLSLLSSVCLVNPAFALEPPSALQVKIIGDIKNTYYLCVSHIGCFNLEIASQDPKKVFPLGLGEIKHIYIVDSANFIMHAQPLPRSCKINVTKDQTITVHGKVFSGTNGVYIKGLRCSMG